MTDDKISDGEIMEFEDELEQTISRLRARGLSDPQIRSIFETAAKNFVADTVEIVERREGRKLSDKEIEEISEKANAAFVQPLGLERLQ